MEKLYVLAGKAGTGKDSIAKIIENNYLNKKVIIYQCTFYLKKYISQIYKWDGKEETKPRELLQTLGREIREKYPDFFIKRMEEDIKFLSQKCDIIIITGIRLQKELDFLKNKFNGILIKVQKNKSNAMLTTKEKNDITETNVDHYHSYNYIIDNDDTLEKLKQKIKLLIEEVEYEH